MKSIAKQIKGTHPVVRKPRSPRYRFLFSHVYSFYLVVFHLLPRYLYHFLKRPYCRAMPTLAYQLSLQSLKQTGAGPSHRHVPMKVRRPLSPKRNLRGRLVGAFSKLSQKVGETGLHARGPRALFDTLLSFALDAYVERTGAKLAPETGQIVLLLFLFTRYLDDYLDKHREAGMIPSLDEVLTVPEMREQIVTIYRYVEPFSCATLVLKHLWQLLATYYDAYRDAFHQAVTSFRFEDVLAMARLDSGMASRTVMEVVCLFNEYQLDDEILNDFHYFGMIGKFADDISDLVSDVAKGLPNLFSTLTRQNPEESACFQLAIQTKGNVSIAWCKKHCPLTYMRYLEHIEYYYQQLQLPRVKKLALLLFAASYHSFNVNTFIGGDLSS